MSEILFLAHRIPFPPDRGDKIRSNHVLKRLARIAPVHVATFADDEDDGACEPLLEEIATSHILVRRTKSLPVAGIQALASGDPVSLTAFFHPEIAAYVRDVLWLRRIETIYVFSGQMAQYVPPEFTGRVIADLVDVDSAKFEAYAARGSGVRAWMEAREGKVLRATEARIAARAHVSLLVSQAEAELFRSRLPESIRRTAAVRAMGNGIDSAHFDSAAIEPETDMLACGYPRLIFSGQMDYAPNIVAARRAIERILPRVRGVFPDASLHIVGRNPPAEIQRRHGRDGVHVWGRVPDMRTWLAAADMALVPLEIARGIQNKVLEAMSMQLPVVLSIESATGIDARNGIDFLIAETDAELVQAVLTLARDRERGRAMGHSARDWVLDNANWDAVLADLPEIIGALPLKTNHAA